MGMMVVVVDGRHVTRPISIDCWFIVDVVVTVFMVVMPEMCSVARRVFQRIANAHRCRIGGIQREHDGKKKREVTAHGARIVKASGWQSNHATNHKISETKVSCDAKTNLLISLISRTAHNLAIDRN